VSTPMLNMFLKQIQPCKHQYLLNINQFAWDSNWSFCLTKTSSQTRFAHTS